MSRLDPAVVLLDWALSYDAYRGLASSPENLFALIEGARSEYLLGGSVPRWCGVDLLRGWVFYLARADHHEGYGHLVQPGTTANAELTAVIAALRAHPDVTPADLPPAPDLTLGSARRSTLPSDYWPPIEGAGPGPDVRMFTPRAPQAATLGVPQCDHVGAARNDAVVDVDRLNALDLRSGPVSCPESRAWRHPVRHDRAVNDDITPHEHQCFVQQALGGVIDERWCSLAHVDALRNLPTELTSMAMAAAGLTLYDDQRLSIVFTPFDRSNPRARVTFVGLTPGLAQLRLALAAAATGLRSGDELDVALDGAKLVGAFAGAMRTNLISMLDGIGLADALELTSSAALFEHRCELADSTSVICHAVFDRGSNYSGSPPVDAHPVLAAAARQVLAANLAATPHALIVPLGRAAAKGVALSGVDPARVLAGFPHPSGGNGHRTVQYRDHRDEMARTVDAWFTSRG